MWLLFACESDLKNVRKLTQTAFAPSGEVDSIHLKLERAAADRDLDEFFTINQSFH
ncbi:MAG: hypothetical protein RIR36_988, partial [Bacteroidota bacterium]